MIKALDKAMRAKLAGTAFVTALGGTAIYSKQAPAGVTPPYVIYNVAGGGSTNTSPRDDLDVLYTVKCVAADPTKARDVAELCRVALHQQHNGFTMDDGWGCYWLAQEQMVSYVENKEQAQFYHEGANYRIRAAK
jgi:hypothetical protein